MPTTSAAEAQAAWGAALRELELKLRRVRTPEGARKYGVPIGTPITADVIESFRRDRAQHRDPTIDLDAARQRDLERRQRAALEPVSPGLEAARRIAQAKLEALPPIDPKLVAKRTEEAERIARGELRAGGEHRGNSRDRRRSRANLFREFGGERLGHVPCVHCGLPLHHEAGHGLPVLTRDKLRTFRDGGGYQLPNLVPACASCNASRGASDVSFEGPPRPPRRVTDAPAFGSDGRFEDAADVDIDPAATAGPQTGLLVERDVLADGRVHRQRLVNGVPVDDPGDGDALLPPSGGAPEAAPAPDPKAAYARLPKDDAYRIRKKKAAVKFYAKRRDGKDPAEAQADADVYEQAALAEALALLETSNEEQLSSTPEPEPEPEPAVPAPPKAKAKAAKPFAPLHPPSGRTPAHADPLKRGGDGPIHGYSPGQLAYEWNHDDPPPTLVEILPQEPSDPSTAEMWTGGRDGQGAPLKGRYRTTHPVKARVVESKYSGYVGSERTYDVENLWPVEDVPEPLAPPRVVPPDLASVRAAPPELRELVHADELAHLEQMLKRRKAVALDSASDSYEGYLTPDALELRRAKATGLRTIASYVGLDDEEADEAIARLERFLESWRTVGGLFEDREAMHRAVQRLRAGEVADDADTRAMLLQKVWSDATWRAKYGDDPDHRVPISRFVTGDYAAQFEAAWMLTRPRVNPDYEPGNGAEALPALVDPADAVVSQFPLTSWTVTPAGVKSGWIGKNTASVELKIDVGMDETWLNVWSEERFRTRGLKAPGEFIVDDSRDLSLANVELEIDPGGEESWNRTMRRMAVAQVRYGERNAELDPMVAARRAAAGFELGRWPEFMQEELAGIAEPERMEFPPAEPRREYRVYRHRETGKIRTYLMGADDADEYEVLQNYLVADVEAEARLDKFAAAAAAHGWSYEDLRPVRELLQYWSSWAFDGEAAKRGLTTSWYEYDSEEKAAESLRYAVEEGERRTGDLVDALERLGLDPVEARATLDAYVNARIDEHVAAGSSQYKPPRIKTPKEEAAA